MFTNNELERGTNYFYKIVSLNEPWARNGLLPATSESSVVGPVKPVAQVFNMRRIWILIWTLVVCAAILFYISQAKSGKALYVRKIAGIDAVDEAIGRATEMGRKVFYVPGIQDMDDVQTIAAVIILGRVARIAAENDTMLEVPVCKSLVMVTAREAVREAYSQVGRPDAFREDMVHYVTDDQFGYAAAIDGMVVRDKPATMFYMGAFFAESLILGRNRQCCRSNPNRRHGSALTAAVLRGFLRLYTDRRRTLCRQRLPCPRAQIARFAQRTGLRQGSFPVGDHHRSSFWRFAQSSFYRGLSG